MEIEGYDGFELIGRGGSAQVFRARQARVGRDVAIKVLDIDLSSPRLRDAFLRECRLTGRVSNHPAITTIYDTGVTDDGRPYLAMELRAGGSLSREIANGGPIDPARAVAVTVQLAGALIAAHATGVLHRDVKPANVVVSRRGEPALTDFGVAAVLGASEATTGPAFTPAHAAPEVLRGEIATSASDVYSLGSTLYTMLAGESPFGSDGATHYEIMGRALHDPPPPLDPALPAALRDAVGGMLAKDPADRPTLPELINELGEVERAEGWPVTPVVTSVSDDHDTWDPEKDGGIDADDPQGASEPFGSSMSLGNTTSPTRSRTRTRLAAVLGVIAVAIVAVVLALALDDDGDITTSGDTTGSTSTTVPLDRVPEPITYPPGEDRSLAMAVDATRWDAAVAALLGEAPVSQSLPFAQYFADPSFPSIERLPATTVWTFVSPLVAEGPCSRLWTEPLTMTGMVGRLYISSEAVVTIAQMEFATADEAAEFVLGRSLALGAPEDECTVEGDRMVAIDHDAIDIEPPTGADEVNSWVFGPGPQVLPLERGAFGLIVRDGATVTELRIGLRGERVFTPQEISDLVAATTAA